MKTCEQVAGNYRLMTDGENGYIVQKRSLWWWQTIFGPATPLVFDSSNTPPSSYNPRDRAERFMREVIDKDYKMANPKKWRRVEDGEE